MFNKGVSICTKCCISGEKFLYSLKYLVLLRSGKNESLWADPKLDRSLPLKICSGLFWVVNLGKLPLVQLLTNSPSTRRATITNLDFEEKTKWLGVEQDLKIKR